MAALGRVRFPQKWGRESDGTALAPAAAFTMQQSAGSLSLQTVRRVCIPLGDGPSLTGQRVLLVSGDPDFRAAAWRALGATGWEVEAAAHSGHALLAALRGGRLDVLVAELSSPETSGPALLERLRRHHPALRAVFLADAGTSPCEGVLVRPFTRDDLLSALRLSV
jgi:CheY-like chemotaxis protein